MLYPFKLKIFDQHKKQTYEGGELYFEAKDENWLRFDYYFELNDKHITSFRREILFDAEDNPTPCVEVFFSDGTSVYGAYSVKELLEIYTTTYKELFTEQCVNKMQLAGQIVVKKKWQFWR